MVCKLRKDIIAELDLGSLFRNLILDIQYIIINYYHGAIYILDDSEIKCDWGRLLKENFGQNYDKDIYCSDDLNRIYLGNCCQEKINIVSRGAMMLVQINERMVTVYRIVRYRNGATLVQSFELVCLGVLEFAKEIVRISCGSKHVVVQLVDRVVMAQITILEEIKMDQFKEIGGIPMNIADISSGFNHALFLLTDGRLMLYAGEMGKIPFVKDLPGKVVKISCGTDHSAIVLEDGRLLTSGSNWYGQLGDKVRWDKGRSLYTYSDFHEVNNLPRNIVRLVCTHYNTFILFSDGVLMACGYNGWGELGIVDTSSWLEFRIIKDVPKKIANINGGDCFSVIQLTDGTLLSTGYNDNYQLGYQYKYKYKNKNFRSKYSPIMHPEKNISRIICGDYFLLIHHTDNNLTTHGLKSFKNDDYQLKLRLD
ncbi:MAG: regulator of chromosome condensation-like protein [Hyperionvirus sp.]|uniref:Regulator of chromosome condensation-like protein n=1 Tax=Hyperionvirus sp. TaxID=2487770 RepID=A0A3G5A830_9VIRU|nr:MAG: regulator of chromosome condensation-like protein [Hyperionvirus sp.]